MRKHFLSPIGGGNGDVDAATKLAVEATSSYRQIFASEAYHSDWREEKARENIAWECTLLEKGHLPRKRR
jgi:hypothetical protein